jgi:hypothetical protein
MIKKLGAYFVDDWPKVRHPRFEIRGRQLIRVATTQSGETSGGCACRVSDLTLAARYICDEGVWLGKRASC